MINPYKMLGMSLVMVTAVMMFESSCIFRFCSILQCIEANHEWLLVYLEFEPFVVLLPCRSFCDK